MSGRFVKLVVVGAILLAQADARAQSRDDSEDKKLAELQARIVKLERRVAELEKSLATTKPAGSSDGRASEAQIQQLKSQARARMRKDREKYSQEQIQQAEQLYQVANKNWRSPEAKDALEKLVTQFPDLDRTGCAVLYLGQTNDGPGKEQLLKDAVEKHGDCFYGNGVQVGAFGRYLLGLYYKDKGENEKATAQFDELRRAYATSIDHGGRLLVDQIPVAATPASPDH